MSKFINRLVLDACLVEKNDLRHTLASIPVIEALFSHSGHQTENSVKRQVDFEIAAIAIGELAGILNQAEAGRYYRLQGFINRKSLKSVKLRLHLTHISPI